MIGRSVDEWITVARISRNVKHLFVEGESDARVLTHLLGYPDDVDIRVAREVDQTVLQPRPYCGGFKLRLIELAIASSIADIENLACLVDADFDRIICPPDYPETLILTSFANLPVCTITFEWVQGYLIKAYGFVLDETVWNFLGATLKYCFAARLISGSQDSPRPAPSISGFISLKNGSWQFDKSSYTSTFFGLHKLAVNPRQKSIDDELSIMNGDLRNFINSNDAFDFIFAILRQSKSIGGSGSREAIRQSYFAAISDDLLTLGAKDALDWIKMQPSS